MSSPRGRFPGFALAKVDCRGQGRPVFTVNECVLSFLSLAGAEAAQWNPRCAQRTRDTQSRGQGCTRRARQPGDGPEGEGRRGGGIKDAKYELT